MKDYNKEIIEYLEKKLVDISQEVKNPFSNKKQIKEEYLKVFEELENKRHKTLKKIKKSVKKWIKVGKSGGKNQSE
jgi:DNA repair ATPase RecN